MAHRAFFSFHYELDVWRASIVRNSDVTKKGVDAEWIDASMWEEAKKKGEAAVKRLIDNALIGTSVTAVLIGSQTSSRPYVKYEIDQSITRGNGMLGIYIHNIEDRAGQKATKGLNPLPSKYSTYDWVYDNGYLNLGKWVDAAYDEAH
jgi:hypothetical protein